MKENNFQYKHTSKINWLSQIPIHWCEVRLGSLFNERKSKVSDIDYPPLSVTKNGIVPQLENAAKSNDGDNRKLVLNGDFVINSRSDRKGSSGLSRLDGSVSLINIVLRPIENIDPKFFEYLLKSYFFKEEYYRYGRGIVEDLWTTRYSEMKNMIVPKPPFEEQTAIARFLDYKLAKINRFIQKKKQLIKLLNEQKAAIINQAVTKGLDPNAKMKDSGIEWLGEIPEHWEKHKLKYLISKPIAGAWGAEPQNDDNDITCVRVADFSEYEIKTDNLTIRNIEAKSEQILKPGDLLLEKSGGGEKTPVGRVVLFNQSFKAVTSNFVSKFSTKIDLVSSEYLLYIFKLINSVRWNFRSLKQTTGIQNIDTYQYMDNWVFIPKIEEQKIIVNHIKSEFKILDETISKIEKEIALVEEYKTALIAEAVTGKIDVRGYEVPEISEEETYEDLEEEISITSEDAEAYQTVEE